MNSKFLIRTLLIIVSLTLLNFLLDLALSSKASFSYYGWQTVSNMLIFILIGYYIFHSNLAGIGLSLSVFSIYYVIGFLNLLIESLIFNLVDIKGVLNLVPRSLVIALIISPATVYMLSKWNRKTEKNEFSSRPFTNWLWRVAFGAILYLVFYIAAGLTLTSVYPELTKFYSEKSPPPPELIFGTQLIRGLVFVSIAILICWTVNLSLFRKAVLTGLIFSVIGGIAPLILPGGEMPSNIRLGHGFEVGISNFLYGMILAYLFSQKSKYEKSNYLNPA